MTNDIISNNYGRSWAALISLGHLKSRVGAEKRDRGRGGGEIKKNYLNLNLCVCVFKGFHFSSIYM